MKKLLFCLLPVSALLALPAHANLSIHPMRAAVDAKRGTQIRVYSQSTIPQYVQTRLRRIVNPATPAEEEQEMEASDAAIAITPGKFALSGGGNRLIRVIPLQQVQKETAYRLYFEGVRGPDDAPLEDGEGAQANIGVSLVWGRWSMSPPTMAWWTCASRTTRCTTPARCAWESSVPSSARPRVPARHTPCRTASTPMPH